MRINFASKKHAENVARRIKHMLSGSVHERPVSIINNGLARACGFRNWNELQDQLCSAPPSDVDQDMAVAQVEKRYAEFSHRLAVELGIPDEISIRMVDVMKPFAGHQKVPALTDEFTRNMAQRITDHFGGAEPINDGDVVGFRVLSPERLFGLNGRSVIPSGGKYELRISPAGEILDAGARDYEWLMKIGGLWDRGVKRESDVLQSKAVLDVLSRLDRQILHLHRSAGSGTAFNYNEAARLDRSIPLFKMAQEMPGIAAMFTLAYRDQYAKDQNWDRYDVLGADPFTAYCDSIMRVSKKAWPNLAVSEDRIRSVAKRFLSIPVGDYAIDPNLPAFLCHVPDSMFPRSTKEADAAVNFVDMTGSFFRHVNGLGMSPVKFVEEFIQKAEGSWAAADRLRNHWIIPGQTIGCSILGAAAFENGHDIYPGEFEDDEDNVSLCELIGKNLVTASGVGFFTLLEVLNGFSEKVDITEPEDPGKVSRDYERLSKSAIIPASQRGMTASKLLACYGFDIEEIISRTWSGMSLDN